jgi:hypothetical protein
MPMSSINMMEAPTANSQSPLAPTKSFVPNSGILPNRSAKPRSTQSISSRSRTIHSLPLINAFPLSPVPPIIPGSGISKWAPDLLQHLDIFDENIHLLTQLNCMVISNGGIKDGMGYFSVVIAVGDIAIARAGVR